MFMVCLFSFNSCKSTPRNDHRCARVGCRVEGTMLCSRVDGSRRVGTHKQACAWYLFLLWLELKLLFSFALTFPSSSFPGISLPRKAKDGTELPSARTVSLIVHRPFYRDDPKFTVMLAIWGQFLDHDITATALSQKSNGSTISCCANSGMTSPECFPVILDPEDPFREYNVSCMEFVRSAPAPTCCLGPREQLNQATPFIDGSVVYGHDENVVKSLREMRNGTMKVFKTLDGRDLLPKSEDMNDGCNREEEERQGMYCFATGKKIYQ